MTFYWENGSIGRVFYIIKKNELSQRSEMALIRRTSTEHNIPITGFIFEFITKFITGLIRIRSPASVLIFYWTLFLKGEEKKKS